MGPQAFRFMGKMSSRTEIIKICSINELFIFTMVNYILLAIGVGPAGEKSSIILIWERDHASFGR